MSRKRIKSQAKKDARRKKNRETRDADRKMRIQQLTAAKAQQEKCHAD